MISTYIKYLDIIVCRYADFMQLCVVLLNFVGLCF